MFHIACAVLFDFCVCYCSLCILCKWIVKEMPKASDCPQPPFSLFALCALLLFCWLISFPLGHQTRFLAFVGKMKGGLRDGYWTLHGKEVGFYSSIQSHLPVLELPFIYICFVKDITEKFNAIKKKRKSTSRSGLSIAW